MTTACLGLATMVSAVWVTDRSTLTRIDVKMRSGGCAKKIAPELSEVPGVAEVRADPETDVLIVVPKSKLPSSRAQWEAVGKAGHKPTKLQGPYGTFTSKPKS